MSHGGDIVIIIIVTDGVGVRQIATSATIRFQLQALRRVLRERLARVMCVIKRNTAEARRLSTKEEARCAKGANLCTRALCELVEHVNR